MFKVVNVQSCFVLINKSLMGYLSESLCFWRDFNKLATIKHDVSARKSEKVVDVPPFNN